MQKLRDMMQPLSAFSDMERNAILSAPNGFWVTDYISLTQLDTGEDILLYTNSISNETYCMHIDSQYKLADVLILLSAEIKENEK